MVKDRHLKLCSTCVWDNTALCANIKSHYQTKHKQTTFQFMHLMNELKCQHSEKLVLWNHQTMHNTTLKPQMKKQNLNLIFGTFLFLDFLKNGKIKNQLIFLGNKIEAKPPLFAPK